MTSKWTLHGLWDQLECLTENRFKLIRLNWDYLKDGIYHIFSLQVDYEDRSIVHSAANEVVIEVVTVDVTI